MRPLNAYVLILSIFMAGTICSIACYQYYLPKASIIMSCEDPIDEDGSSEFGDDKEHTYLIIAFINPPFAQSPELFYQEIQSSHSLEISVPPPEV